MRSNLLLLLFVVATQTAGHPNDHAHISMALDSVLRIVPQSSQPYLWVERIPASDPRLVLQQSSTIRLNQTLAVSGYAGLLPEWSRHSLANGEWPSTVNSSERRLLGHKDTLLPDATDPETVLSLALMAFNSYYEPSDSEWIDVPEWTPSTDPAHDLITMVIKGTSLTAPFIGGKTGANDKLNDNKMFSCQCVSESADFKESYYRLATTIADAAMNMYPHSTIWTTGHSLGGALSALVSLTFDLPAITFESPGDLLFARRIGLLPPSPPIFYANQRDDVQSPQEIQFETTSGVPGGDEDWEEYLNTLPIYQFGNDGDPIYLGTCLNGFTSSCWLGGYAMETKCHIGKECVYRQNEPILRVEDNNGEEYNGYAVETAAKESINNHGIQYVLDTFLKPRRQVPPCRVNELNPKCIDCEKWSWVQ
ncbi:putative lipase atg15 [Entophlyctis sp. JEL0112]|nr:putative lipase atg15 [Entophlyctis sp. JEL0112]